jgi:hypothetical protein
MSKLEFLRDNKDEILRLYQEENVNKHQLGKIFLCSGALIHKFLIECGITVEPQVKTVDLEEKIIELHFLGLSQVKIAQNLNIGRTSVGRVYKKYNLESSFSTHRQYKLKEHKKEIKEWYDAGLGCTTLAKMFNCAESSICRLLKEEE